MKLRSKPTPRPLDYICDWECYPNFSSCSIKHPLTGNRWLFEISEWKNQAYELYELLCALQQIGANMIGYNNFNYDGPLTHLVMVNFGRLTHNMIYKLSSDYFAQPFGSKNRFIVWPKNQLIHQLDLMKIHHFDRVGGMIGLKMIEYNMQSYNIKDLPVKPNTFITRAEADEILTYNDHDVDETEKLYLESIDKIEFRKELSDKYNRDFTNHNDTKIGKDYFAMELQKAGIKTHRNYEAIQSRREEIRCGEVLLPQIKFEHPELIKIHDFFKAAVIDEKDEKGLLKLKGFFKDVTCTIDDLEIKFGAGGLHASRSNEIVRESETHVLLDWDVASYYPNIAIVNGFFPEHLTKKFCEIYLDVYMQRKGFAKKTVENEMLKLALNGVYGDSNAAFGIFHDPKYTCSITINGQLLLCMLAEKLMMKIPNLRIIQLNTDGLTFLCPKEWRPHANAIWQWWELLTKLTLEENEYEAMYINHVNSYIAKTKAGQVKRIGCYAYETALENPSTRELVFKKDWGKRIVAKAAEAALVYNQNIEQFILGHADKMDFMLRTKVPKGSQLTLETETIQKLQSISRYYVSKNGGMLVKTMPPTEAMIKRWQSCDHYFHVDNNKHAVVSKGRKPPSGKYKLGVIPTPIPEDRRIRIEAGLLVRDCSNMDDFADDIDFEYYIEETKKIVNPLLMGTQS